MAVDAETLKALPTGPGCYLFRDSDGSEIYVGKAKNIRKRVSSYFHRGRGHPTRTLRLVQEAVSVNTIETDSEVEALLLENRLIKELQPRYNVNLKDGKEYPLLAISRDPFPKVFITRNSSLRNVDLIGPFASATQLRRAYHFLMRVFQFRTCDLDIQEHDPQRRYFTPCLNYHIKRCSAPCTLRINQEQYNDDIKALRAFLAGRNKRQVVDTLRQRMAAAASDMRYEDAARYRDQLQAIDRLQERGRLRDWQGGPAPVIAGDEGARKLAQALGLEHSPRIIEGFDIAHYMGTHVVAAMVQFVDGIPNKDGYRRFRVHGEAGDDNPGNNDFAAMREVVARRYARLRDEGRDFPDILLIDGGLGQVHMAVEALRTEQVHLPCVVGLAKREETMVLPSGDEIRLSRRNPGLKLLQYVRDEAHRFSRRYLHLLQGKQLRPERGRKRKQSP
ncbi:MAG: excinuclease ABC subunit UvrC [Planctomycetota bacterium]|nr:MAG: excinuclease ABC subunit UvrC [Planctomycetota bacterium]